MLKEQDFDMIMDYESFCERLKCLVSEEMGEEYFVSINKVLKNNSMHYDGLVIVKKGESISPNFYLEHYFERYQLGEELTELLSEIIEMYEGSREEMEKFDIDFSFDNCKERIIYRLISAKQNEEKLEKIPYIPFLDLAITFYCLVKKEDDSIGTVCINEELQKLWKISTKELFQIAQNNTCRLFPAKVTSIYTILMQMAPETVREELQEERFIDEPYVLTNEGGVNGASVLLYENVLQQFAEQVQSNVYILPSSIHEVLLLPEKKEMEPEHLHQMVMDVNKDCVSGEEFLSNQVYRYLWKEDRIEYAVAAS